MRTSTNVDHVMALEEETSDYFLHTSRWNDTAMLNASTFVSVLRDSIFAPARSVPTIPTATTHARGYANMEGLEAGAILIMVSHRAPRHVSTPRTQTTLRVWRAAGIPVPQLHDWADVGTFINRLKADQARLHGLWLRVQSWYAKQKQRTKSAVRQFIRKRLWTPVQDMSAAASGFCMHRSGETAGDAASASYYLLQCTRNQLPDTAAK